MRRHRSVHTVVGCWSDAGMTAAKKARPVAATNPLIGVKLFKVLGQTGEACHGGSGTWPLPQGNEPGEWMHITGTLELCRNGLHLTDKPLKWWQPDARLFEVEVASDAEVVGSLTDGDHKVAVNAARLVREADWSDHCVWFEGEHSLNEGEARTSGKATVEAYGSATVEAYDSATVKAYGSATVKAYGSATVKAYDSATVKASGKATVEAYDSATVKAYGSATVKAYGSATVEAYDSATVKAYGSATVISTIYHSRSATVALANLAAHVDRRDETLELRRAE
jgi:hypothetical protein